MSSAPQEPPAEADWRLRPYRSGDEVLLREGFERVFGRPISEATWQWKLKTRPAPTENVWLAVDRDERPVFHYAGIPCRLRLPAGCFDAMVAVDLWTLPEYRRRGIFTRCASWVHEHWRRAGVVGLLGAPNEQYGSRDRYLGWRRLLPLRWLIRPLRPEAIAARRLGISLLERVRWPGRLWDRLSDVRPETAPGIEIRLETPAGLAGEQRLDTARCCLERSEPWIRWRYLQCPRYDYSVLVARRKDRMVGYLAYRLDDAESGSFAFIAELAASPEDPGVREALIGAAIERLRDAGSVAVATLAVPSTDLYRAWRRRGFLFSWGDFGIQCLPLRDEMSPGDLRDPSLWDLSGGDFDVI